MTVRMLGLLLCIALWMNASVSGAAEKSPFVREVRTGYLVNCTFRAIRPYIWKQTPLLTGWETDAQGGTWESSPRGFLFDTFAFHKDWFKLQDTSAEHAVTISRQFARQTAGKITLELRFMVPDPSVKLKAHYMLPSPLDGAAWQLRDLDDVAVGLIIHHGNLCYETSGEPVSMTPLVLDHEYGVRIDADLDTKTAAIYIEGELKAEAAPFVHPVSSLDSVRITTGDTAVGEMYLPMVRIFKGYAVCETFATCGLFRTPSDWKVNGKARVSGELRSESGPDTHSLVLERDAEVAKSFTPCRAKTVWEFKILFPWECDDATAQLTDDSGRGGTILAADRHLCYVDPQGQRVPLVENRRDMLWYDVKVVADPASGKADIFVNGKQVVAAADFAPAVESFQQVRFAVSGAGTFVDDVRIYAWQDYPADYVPAPQVAPRKGDYLVGVQSCSLWKEGDAYAGWEYVYPFAERRKPYLGWYDEGSPEVADWEIKWQVEHGIDFEQYCWYRPNDAKNYPIKNGVLEHGIRDGLFNARYSALKKFTIMYTNQGAGDTNPQDWKLNIIPYWIEYFFKDPRYLKIDGKPVLAIYYPDNFLRDFQGVEGACQAIQQLRDDCVQAGFPGVIVLMELRTANQDVMQKMKEMGIDYCYAYTWGTPDVNRQRQENVAQRDAAAVMGLGMLPSISMGWQTSPWDGTQDPGNGWVSVADYRALAQWAKDEFMPTLPQNSLGRRVLMLANWNEFGEGHFIMPSNLAGFGYVDSLREVFCDGDGGPHTDVQPAPSQMRRFNVLFPRE